MRLRKAVIWAYNRCRSVLGTIVMAFESILELVRAASKLIKAASVKVMYPFNRVLLINLIGFGGGGGGVAAAAAAAAAPAAEDDVRVVFIRGDGGNGGGGGGVGEAVPVLLLVSSAVVLAFWSTIVVEGSSASSSRRVGLVVGSTGGVWMAVR